MLRHAPLSQVRIEVERENTRVRLQFTDTLYADGSHLPPELSPLREGGGLQGMRERVAELGGHFQVTQ